MQFAPPELLFAQPKREGGASVAQKHPLHGERVDEMAGGGSVAYFADGSIAVKEADGGSVAYSADGTITRCPAPPADGAVPEADAAAAAAVASVARVPGGAGWRVRGVDESGKALDAGQHWGAFEPLRAATAFDVWGFGVVLYEMLMRSSMWHADADSNLDEAEAYRALGMWSVKDAKERASRLTDSWAQARSHCACWNPSSRCYSCSLAEGTARRGWPSATLPNAVTYALLNSVTETPKI